MPALLTSTSRPLKCVAADSTARVTSALHDTSAVKASADPDVMLIELRGGGVERRAIAIDHRDARALTRHVQRDGLPDALGRAGDQHGLAVERHTCSLARTPHRASPRCPGSPPRRAERASAGDTSPVIARCTFRHSASSHCGYAAKRGGMIIVCSVSASKRQRSRHGRFGGGLRAHGGERAGRGTGWRRWRASPSCDSNEVRWRDQRRRAFRIRARRGSSQTSDSRRRRRGCPPVLPAAAPGRRDRRRGRSPDRDRGDSCPASPTPSPHRRRGTTPRSRRNAS